MMKSTYTVVSGIDTVLLETKHFNDAIRAALGCYDPAVVLRNHSGAKESEIIFRNEAQIHIDEIDVPGRCNIVRAMDTLARCINNENIIDLWLKLGVADGDIDDETRDSDILDYVSDEEYFAELMHLFLNLMDDARHGGGLYYDGVCSQSKEEE